MNSRRRHKRKHTDGFIPPAMMVLMIFVAIFAILLMAVAIVRGVEERNRQKSAGQQLCAPIAVQDYLKKADSATDGIQPWVEEPFFRA